MKTVSLATGTVAALGAVLFTLVLCGPAIAGAPLELRLIAQIGGASNSVDVVATRAYLGQGPRLVVVDVTQPAAPIFRGQTSPLPYVIEDIEVSGSYAYVADGDGGLQVVNIANPLKPLAVASLSLPGSVRDVVVVGSFAYIAAGSGGLSIVDVSVPTNPRLVGQYATDAMSVDVLGRLAFVATRLSGVLVLDVSKRNAPVLLDTWNEGTGTGRDILINGTFAYFADTRNVWVIDVSNPQLIHTAVQLTPGANALTLSGNYLYAGLRVYDVTVRSNPRLVGAIFGVDTPTDFVAANGFLYVSVGAGGLRVVDVRAPNAAVAIGLYDKSSDLRNVVGSGQYLFAAAYSEGIQDFNVSTPTTPLLVGQVRTNGGYDVAAANSAAFLADGAVGLDVISVFSPSTPYLFGLAVGDARRVTTFGLRAAFVGADSRFRLLNITVPTAPQQLGVLVLGMPANAVALSADLGFVVDSTAFRVIDLSNPLSPVEVGQVSNPGLGVAVSGSRAYVAAGSDGLRVYDFSTPSQPTQIGQLVVSGASFNNVTISGSRAYITGTGLVVADISDPTSPSVITSIQTSGHSMGAAVSGNNVFVADSDGGLAVFRLAAPIVDAITVTSPNGGESWRINTTQTIRWTYTGNPGSKVKIQLIRGATIVRTLSVSASVGSGGNGSFSWTIPNSIVPGTNFTILITSVANSAIFDSSDAGFTITQ